MSQIIKTLVSGGPLPPAVPTSFVTNSGTAIPALNILNVLGAAGTTTSGSGNTITITSAATGSLTFTNVGGLTLNGANTSTVSIGGTLLVGFGYVSTFSSGTSSPNNGYIVTAGSIITLPPDASANQSDKVSLIVDTAGQLVIQASPGQTIRIAGQSSSVGGTATNTKIGDSVELIYLKLSELWISQNANGTWLLA
jgi:hypothetical protein